MTVQPTHDFLPFARRYANWKGNGSVCLTFDVDFAPDYMLANVLDLLDRFGARATFLATHDSELLKQVAQEGKHEVGLHPNLMPGSTQGANLTEILDSLKRAFPEAVGNRFHLLAHSYRDLTALGRRSFRYDVSSLRFNCPYVMPAWHPDLGMVLFTYTWEDGICENAGLPMRVSSVDLDSPGMKIINFHPMNVYVNGEDASARLTFLRENPDLLGCPQRVAMRYRRSAGGAESVLTAVLERLARQRRATVRLADVAAAFVALLNRKIAA